MKHIYIIIFRFLRRESDALRGSCEFRPEFRVHIQQHLSQGGARGHGTGLDVQRHIVSDAIDIWKRHGKYSQFTSTYAENYRNKKKHS